MRQRLVAEDQVVLGPRRLELRRRLGEAERRQVLDPEQPPGQLAVELLDVATLDVCDAALAQDREEPAAVRPQLERRLDAVQSPCSSRNFSAFAGIWT